MSIPIDDDDDRGYVRDLTSKTLKDLTLEDVVYCHLSRRGWEPIKGATIYTTLDSIETEMRQSRGINIVSAYLPLLAGFSILEQLGDNYENKSLPKHPNSGGGIERALYYFCGYAAMSPEVKALYALRNGLVHAASLTSSDQATQAKYIFRYTSDGQAAVRMPPTPWDGQLSTLESNCFTIVDPRVITDQVSHAIGLVRTLFFDDRKNLRIRQSNKNHILVRHLIWGA